MKNLNILKKLIKEELAKALTEGDDRIHNYMFFQNLKTIHQATAEMLQMNPEYTDEVLSNGHQWAVDHIATSADDVEEVYKFLQNKGCMTEGVGRFAKKALDVALSGDLIGAMRGNIPSSSGGVRSTRKTNKRPKKYNLTKEEKDLEAIIASAEDILEWPFATMGFTPAQKTQLANARKILADLQIAAQQASDDTNSVDEGKSKKGFTSKFDNDPKLKGKQRNLPDALQDEIVNSK